MFELKSKGFISSLQEKKHINSRIGNTCFINHIKSKSDLLEATKPELTTSSLQPRISAIVGVKLTISPTWLFSFPTDKLPSIPCC